MLKVGMILSEEKRTQILSYIVHAGELLKKSKHFPINLYKYAYLPSGPELYTGVLKAAGYLFLDKSITNIIFIVEQKKHPKEIINYSNDEEILIWGRAITNNGKIYTKKTLAITTEILDQLLYTRILTDISSTTILGIGTEVKEIDIIKMISKIKKDSNCGIIVLQKELTVGKEENEKIIDNLIQKKPYLNDINQFGNIYTAITNKYNGKPELIMYINRNELSIKKSNKIGLICMVA